MSDREVLVHVDLEGWPLPSGMAVGTSAHAADIKPRVLTTAIDLDDSTASLDFALSVVDYFELEEAAARAIPGEVGPTP